MKADLMRKLAGTIQVSRGVWVELLVERGEI